MTVELINKTVATLIIIISYLHAHHPLLFCKVSIWLQSVSTRIFIYNTWAETFLFCSNTKVGRKAQSARDFHLQEETGYCRKQEMQEIDSRQKKRLDGKKKNASRQKRQKEKPHGNQKKTHGRKKNFAVKRKRELGGWVKFSKCTMG